MKLRPRLVLVIGLSTLLPLVFTGVSTSRMSRAHSLSVAQELGSRQAQGLAVFAATWLGELLRGTALAVQIWEVPTLTLDERAGLQRILYRQFVPVNAVVMSDGEGVALTEATRFPDEAALLASGLEGHRAVDDERLGRLWRTLPRAEAVAAGVALGPVRREAGEPVVPVAISPAGGGVVVGLELSLSEVEAYFRTQAPASGAAVIVDGAGRVIIGDDPGLINGSAVGAFVGDVGGDLVYELGAGERVLASFQTVSGTDWTAVIAVPESVATAASREIERRSFFVYGIALVLVAGMGLMTAAQIARPVLALRRATRSLGDGALDTRVDASGEDELAELAGAFNDMARRLQDDQQVIAAKNAEIEAFNAELQQRVDERTRELQQSQDRLVSTARMAAVAELGAGLAHELNNPVAGILGLSQVARMQASGGLASMIGSIESEAQRCREILKALGRFSGAAGEGTRDQIALAELVDGVLQLTHTSFADAQLQVHTEVAGELVVLGDNALLGQALAQLLKSLRSGLAPQGVIRITGVDDPEHVGLEFQLVGESRVGGDDWLASGMGFWVARRILQEHDGELVEPAAGESTYALILPRVPDDVE